MTHNDASATCSIALVSYKHTMLPRKSCASRLLPALQIAYMLIVATGYYLCWSSLFTRLPTTNHGEEHM